MTGHNLPRKLLNWWISKKREGFYILLALLFSALYMAGFLMESSRPSCSAMLKQVGFTGFLLTAALALLHIHLHGNYQFLNLFRDMDHLPKKQMELVGSFSMTVFLAITFLGMLSASLGLDPLWHMLYTWFTSLFQPAAAEPEPLIMPEAVPAMPDLARLLGEPEAAPPWTETLDLILQAVGCILMAVILFLILRSALRAAWTWLTRPRHLDDDEKIYFKPAFLPSALHKQEPIRQTLRRHLSYNGKIRRHYRKQILILAKKKKLRPQAWASPDELEKAVELDHETLHQLYEKARYSHLECSEEDWRNGCS